MSLKHSFSLLILLLFFQIGMAQDEPIQRFNAGLMLGGSIAQIHGDFDAGYNKLGLLAGINAQIRFTQKAELGVEINFNQLGSRSTTRRSIVIDPFKATLNYVMVPVYMKYKDWFNEEGDFYHIHAYGGLSYGRLISTPKLEGNPFEALDGFLRDDYLGLLIGVTYHINSKLGAGARWERGLLDLYNNNFDSGPNITRGRLQSLNLGFYVTYSFL